MSVIIPVSSADKQASDRSRRFLAPMGIRHQPAARVTPGVAALEMAGKIALAIEIHVWSPRAAHDDLSRGRRRSSSEMSVAAGGGGVAAAGSRGCRPVR